MPEPIELAVKKSTFEARLDLTPLVFQQFSSAEVCDGLLAVGERYSVTAEHFRLNRNDDLFDYSVALELFNGLGRVQIGGHAAYVQFDALDTTTDFKIICDILNGVIDLTIARLDGATRVEWAGHCNFPSEVKADEFFRTHAPAGWSYGGRSAINISKEDDAQKYESAKITMEKSFSLADSAFLDGIMFGLEPEILRDDTNLWNEIARLFQGFEVSPKLQTPG